MHWEQNPFGTEMKRSRQQDKRSTQVAQDSTGLIKHLCLVKAVKETQAV